MFGEKSRLREFRSGGPFGDLAKAVGLSPDGKWLALRVKGGVEVRDTANGNLVRRLESTRGPVAFSPKGKWLVTGGTNGLDLWDTGSWNHVELNNAMAHYNNVAFTSDETRLACENRASWREIQLCDLPAGTITIVGSPGDENPDAVAVSPDGKWLAVGNMPGEIWLWDLATRQLALRYKAHRKLIYGLAFSPDSTLMATGGNDQLIHLWETGTTNKLATLQGHLDEIWSLEFSRDGQILVSASKDGTAKLWNVKFGPTKSKSFALETNAVPLGPLADGSALLTLDRNPASDWLWGGPDVGMKPPPDPLVTRLWSLADGRFIRSNNWSQFDGLGCRHALFLPGNQQVMGVSTNGTVHIWGLTTGTRLRSIQLGGTGLRPLLVSHDNRWLLAIRAAGCALYDLRAARLMHEFPELRWDFQFAAFSPDSRWLAGGTTNFDIIVWDLASNRQRMVLKGHKWFVFGLSFSPNSKLLASGGWDSQVWLWSLETGIPLYAPLKGHQSGVTPIVFSSDGKTLITGSDDGTIRWWNVATGKEMLLFEEVSMLPWNRTTTPTDINPGGNVVVWAEERGAIRSVKLSTLAEIDAAEAAQAKEK